jgi:hypothetical protein
MSVFGSIVSAIFGSKHAASVTPAAGATTPSAGSTASTAAGGASASARSSAPPAADAAAPARSPAPPAAGASAPSAASASAKPLAIADVEAIIAKLASEQHEDLNWKQSIVDLMKLLKLDSSLSARKQLAQELGYTGALNGSAEMNTWLHQQVMKKLAESGGKVPDSLKA